MQSEVLRFSATEAVGREELFRPLEKQAAAESSFTNAYGAGGSTDAMTSAAAV